jgi:hypothetical protein
MRQGAEFIRQQRVAFAEAAGRRNHVGAIPDHAVEAMVQPADIDGSGGVDVGRIVGGEGRHHGHQTAEIARVQHGVLLMKITLP